MSDADQSGFGKFVPGFEFMQNLARQATGGLTQGVQQAMPQMPSLSSWVAPTFNVEDLEKRIQELKAVHFWLDQNTRALAATIQALEVQKMTLATLKGMNFSMGEVANSLKIKATDTMAGLTGFGGKPPAPPAVSPYAASFAPAAPVAPPVVSPYAASFAPAAPPVAVPQPMAAPAAGLSEAQLKAAMFPFGMGFPAAPAPAPAAAQAAPVQPPAPAPSAPVATTDEAAKPASAGVVDPMQWWGALTQQFQAIATNAMKEASAQTAVDAGKNITSALAREAVKTATEMTAGLTRGIMGSAKAGGKPDAKTGVKASGKVDAKAGASGSTGAASAKAANPVTKATSAVVGAVGKTAAKAVTQVAAKAASKTATKVSAPSAKPAAKGAKAASPAAARGRAGKA